VFSKEEYNKVEDGLLGSYTFGWKSVGDDGKVVRKGEMALALGMGSLFNHSATPNVSYTLHPETLTIHYQTTRPVATWEELCICYGDKLWFEDANAGAQDRIAGGRDGGRGREAKIRMKDEEEHEDDDAEESVLQALMAIELGETQ
jgi:tRNA-specific adenosine deaminase 3